MHTDLLGLFLVTNKNFSQNSQRFFVILCRYAFVEFGTVTDAEKVLLSSKHVKIGNKVANIDVCRNKMKPESEEGIFDHY